MNQLGSAYDVITVSFGDAIASGIDPTLINIVESMGPLGASLTVANALAYSATVVLLIMRAAAALPGFAAALVCDLTGWVMYSTQSTYDFWAASSHQIDDWVANGLLLVCLIGLIILRQAGGLPRRLGKLR
ncbi:hypothetical protein [Maricaulis sp.]|uniref:hypothetical protein n=1 Tax=Maricaulis sp. TaxID=1486257 RepID=UPI0025C06484|nr:hypothetical protein [Maricaulis sp.]